MTSVQAIADSPYLDLLLRGAAATSDRLVEAASRSLDDLAHRPTMRAVLALVAVDIAEGADSPATHERANAALDYAAHLATLQDDGGLFSSEGNLLSPPDTAFAINDLCLCVGLIDRYAPGRFEELRAHLARIAAAAAPALIDGGVHTPNHRWELASALAALNVHWPDPRLVSRAERWLAEGVDIDEDGLYSERSAIYAAEVTNPSLISLARDLTRPELLEHVRRNLRATTALVEDDGEVENVHSRRQDQRLRYDVESYLSPLRLFAILDGDADLSRIVSQILGRPLREPERHLADLLHAPELGAKLPDASPASTSSATFYPASRLLRLRENDLSVSIFAGSDFGTTGRISSGLSNSSTLVRARRGDLVLRSVRVSPTFFALGCIRPQSMERTSTGAILSERRASGYYDPLPDGVAGPVDKPDDEGRYFASMDFDRRPLRELSLETTVRVDVDRDGVDLHLSFTGLETRYAVELVIDGEPTIDGARPTDDGWWIDGRSAMVRHGNQSLSIETDPGDDHPPDFDDGETFTYTGGRDRIPGTRLLIGGSTLAPRRIRLRFS